MASRSDSWLASDTRISMPSPPSIRSTLSIAARVAMPSVSVKPIAKSSRSAGLAINTACVEPP